MDRDRLDELSIEELKNEAAIGFVPAISQDQLIDQIMTHLERNGPLANFSHSSANGF